MNEKNKKEVILWTPHKAQTQILEHPARFKVCNLGRRAGKTIMAINYLLEEALMKKNGRYWYVSPTYSQSKMIAWDCLKEALKQLPPELVTKRNESELYVRVGNNSLIELKGADKEDSLRGAGLDGIVLDEYAIIKSNVFDEVIRPALTDKKGWAIFISTPKGYNHFHDLFQKGLDKEQPDYASFHFTSYDNPFLDRTEIDQARIELGDEVFQQEYLAEFRKYTGLIYKEFERETHICPEWMPAEGEQVWRAMDFGAVNPTVCLWIHIDRDEIVTVFDEFVSSELTTDERAGIIMAKHPEYEYALTFGDPSGKQEQLDYGRHGLYITPATKIVPGDHDWVISGINEVKKLLKVHPTYGRAKLRVTENCTTLIKEFESYRWLEKPKHEDTPRKDVPVKVDDHCLDALRYFAVSHRPTLEGRSRRKQRVDRERSSVTGY